MIPKVIHYCWFGNSEKPELVLKCIESWKKYCPNYRIVEWNESNFKSDNLYFRQAIENGKWSFASDYARLEIIYKYGGIYLDTDIELLKPLDSLLTQKAYIGTEVGGEINTGLGFGAEINSFMVKEMLDEYASLKFVQNGELDLTPCPVRNTASFIRNGYNRNEKICVIKDMTVYPDFYFAPKNYLTREIHITKDTVSIHHYDGAWMVGKSKIFLKIKEFMGPRFNRFIYKIRGIDV